MPKYKYSLVACARWEEKDIVEWIEYHRSVGFEHFYIYSNDDDPMTLYDVLKPYLFGEAPLVTYSFWPRLGEQMEMYNSFLRNFKDETEWACFLDIDEFLLIRNSNNIDTLVSSHSELADCIYFNWINYGNNRKKARDNKSILQTLYRRSQSPDPHTKTIFRTNCISEDTVREGLAKTGLPFTHFWTNYPFPKFRTVDVLGRNADRYAEDFPHSACKFLDQDNASERIITTAYVAHFMFKSEEDFIRRAARGGFLAQTMWKDRYERNEHHAILNKLNEIEDRYLADYWTWYTSKKIHFPIGGDA